MAITSSGTVFISKPDDLSYGETMSRFRDWLDANKIEPVVFKSSVQSDGIVAFEIAFRSTAEAALFNREFG